MTLEEGLASTSAQANDLIKSQSAFSMYDGNGWVGSLDSLVVGKAYQVKLSQAGALTVLGDAVDPAATPIAIASGWNWVGYLPQAPLTVDEALASLTPTAGDLVKSHSQFAQYVDGSGWVGSLAEMTPGQGYLLKSAGGGTLTYPAAAAGKAEQQVTSIAAQRDQLSAPVKPVTRVGAHKRTEASEQITRYNAYSMTLTGEVKLDGQMLADSAVVVRAMVGDEIRGAGQLRYVEAVEGYRVFLMLFADEADGEELTLEIEANGQTHELEGSMPFLSNGAFGTPEQPLAMVVETEAYRAAMAAAALPKTFSLDQNYPNPFNPVTTIHYELPEDIQVRLIVYDVLGREVATLVDEVQKAGRYDVAFDASRLASGMYLYRIEAGTFTKVHRMVLMK